MAETVWVVCDEECSQGALGFTGERAWVAGVPKPLGAALAAHLVGDNSGTFHVAAAPDASVVAPPVSDEAVTPPAEPAPETADPGAQPVEPAAVAAEGTAT